MRVVWCRAHAQAAKSASDYDALEAEVQRAAAYYDGEVGWWETQLNQHFSHQRDYQEGANAYAYQQIFLFRSLRDRNYLLCDIMRDAMGGSGELGDSDSSSSYELSEVLLLPTSDEVGSSEGDFHGHYGEDLVEKELEVY